MFIYIKQAFISTPNKYLGNNFLRSQLLCKNKTLGFYKTIKKKILQNVIISDHTRTSLMALKFKHRPNSRGWRKLYIMYHPNPHHSLMGTSCCWDFKNESSKPQRTAKMSIYIYIHLTGTARKQLSLSIGTCTVQLFSTSPLQENTKTNVAGKLHTARWQSPWLPGKCHPGGTRTSSCTRPATWLSQLGGRREKPCKLTRNK